MVEQNDDPSHQGNATGQEIDEPSTGLPQIEFVDPKGPQEEPEDVRHSNFYFVHFDNYEIPPSPQTERLPKRKVKSGKTVDHITKNTKSELNEPRNPPISRTMEFGDHPRSQR